MIVLDEDMYTSCLCVRTDRGFCTSLEHLLFSIAIVIEGFPAKRAHIAFRVDFYFCRIKLNFGGLICVAIKSIVV